MSRPLFFKELREIWWMALVASAVVLCIVLDAMGLSVGSDWRITWSHDLRHSPFLARGFAVTIGFIAMCLGGALGLWQTLSESVTGTWSYLLHRPVSRRQVVVTKLVTGTGLLIVGIGLPLLMYLCWAVRGRYSALFEFWMTEDTLRFWSTGFVAYLAAFLCGIRAARIYASRLWPVVPALLIFAAQMVFGPFPNIGWRLIFVGVVLLLPSIFFAVENRDYA